MRSTLTLLILLCCARVVWAAGPCVTDAAQRKVCLSAPAQRIVALSPGAVELLYAAGAGSHLVAAVAYSDYPPQARDLPSVGTSDRLDLETILALEPDLVVAWQSGNPKEQVARLVRLGVPVVTIEPRDFDSVAVSLEHLGRLAGTTGQGAQAAAAFRAGIARLATRYQGADPVSVFFQVWAQPLMTINNDHLIGKVIRLCGGRNPFGDLDRLVPRISTASVIKADPEVMVTGGQAGQSDQAFAQWRSFPSLTAVRRDNLFVIPADLITRPTPRLLRGATMLCDHLETARQRR